MSYYSSPGDLLVLISVSGESENLLKGLSYAKENGMKTISFSGFGESNSLKTGSDISLWVNSKSYNIVESIHTVWITLIIDLIVGKSEYSVNSP